MEEDQHMTPSAPAKTTAVQPRFLAPTEGEFLNVVGETNRILADGASSAGRVLIFEVNSPSGNGPPLHRHSHDDEYFYIISGRYKFVCDGREFIADPGAFVCAPKGSVHAFACCAGSPPGRMLVICTPPGLEGPFRACHNAGPNMPMDAIVGAFRKFELEFLGPPIKTV